MSITVLIATYNRAPMLQRCLAQLARQAFEPGDEVVIVDNGSSDATDDVVRTAVARFPVPLRYVVEPSPGKSRALMAGLAAAHGDVLALTDDDVLVGDDWLAAIRALWREADIGLAGGRVTPGWARSAPRWLRFDAGIGYGPLAAPLALLDYGPEPAPLGDRTALGANMAVTRRALDAAGGFPLDLGKLRGTLLSGEDHALCERVQAAGFRAVYDPRLVVRHHVPADRLRLAYYVRWFFWSGITNAALDHRSSARGEAVRLAPLRHWVLRAARGAVRLAAAALTARLPRCIDALTDVAFAIGYLAFCANRIRKGGRRTSSGTRQPEAA